VKKNSKGIVQIIIPIILALVVLTGIGYFALKNNLIKLSTSNVPLQPNINRPLDETSPTTIPNQAPTSNMENWKTYTNNKYSFEFMYPPKLSIIENNEEVTLTHSIPFKNFGDCDMSGGTGTFQTLTDFEVTLMIVTEKLHTEDYYGDYTNGNLKGKNRVMGAEGCGYTDYYFLLNNKFLYVKKANVQALSGISTAYDLNEILSVKGVISREESQQIFHQILSTFKFLDDSSTPTSINPEGKFCGGIAGIACPGGFKCVLDGTYPDAGGKCQKM
jgi:hypothetical protein